MSSQSRTRSQVASRRTTSGAALVAHLVTTALLAGACANSGFVGEKARQDGTGTADLRVCSWNVRNLGHTFDGLEKDHGAVAQVLDEHCDVAVILEVVQKGGRGSHPGFDRLADELGDDWDTTITTEPRPNTSAAHAEYYGFAWRREAAWLCNGWTRPLRIDDGDGAGLTPEPDRFKREPAFACFATRQRGRAMDFILGAFHARWGTVDERTSEVSLLDDDLDGDGDRHDVFEAMRAARPGEEDLLFLADFNLKPGRLAGTLPDYASLTVGDGSTVNADDEITENLYDHLLVPPASDLPELPDPAEVIDVRGAAASGDSFFQRVSDHVLIRFELELDGPDDDEPIAGEPGDPDDPDEPGVDDYYADIPSGLEGRDLARELRALVSDHLVVTRSILHDAFARTDSVHATCDGIHDLYTGQCWDPADTCGQASEEGTCFSRVRVWPKSWWGGDEGMPAYTDLVNARPLDGYAAIRRSNAPLGIVAEARYETASGARVGECAHPDITDGCFEPAEDARGDLARAYFYMAVRYRGTGDCCTEVGVDRFRIEPWMEETLRRWHEADPVTAAERARNDEVFAIQENRNPFVDHPAWVDRIDDF